jgi:hypothetical protein
VDGMDVRLPKAVAQTAFADQPQTSR